MVARKVPVKADLDLRIGAGLDRVRLPVNDLFAQGGAEITEIIAGVEEDGAGEAGVELAEVREVNEKTAAFPLEKLVQPVNIPRSRGQISLQKLVEKNEKNNL